jgi:hypothetical protein
MSDIYSLLFEDQQAVTPSDTVNDPNGPFAGLHIGGSGTVRIINGRGRDVTIVGCQAGTIYPYPVVRVFTTTTTATSILGLSAPAYRAPMNPGLGSVLP